MKRAIYPGSFDPVTYGHIDVIHRAAEMFDKLTVVVMYNVRKTTLFSVEERVKMLKEAVKDIKNVSVDSYSGLVSDYAQTNYMLSDKKLDTVFLTTALEYSYLSSSGVKEIAHFGGDVSQCVPAFVEEALKEKYKH